MFDEFIPNLLEQDQNAAFSQQQEAAPAQIRLSVPIAVPRVPITHPPHQVPPPVPALPPRPIVRPPVNIAPFPPSSSNSSARSSDFENSDNAEPPLPFNIPDSPQSEPETEQPPENDPESPDEQPCTSTTSYDKSVNFAQKRRIRTYEKWQPAARYGERFRKPNLPPSPSQPAILTSEEKRKIIHESSQRALRNPTPSRETKLDQVRVSIQRHQQTTPESVARSTRSRTNQKNTKRSANLNLIQRQIPAQFVKLKGNILHSCHSIVNCVSSDLTMNTGLAKLVANMYRSMRKTGKNQPKFPVGTVIPYFDPYRNRYIFNFVTKEQESDHPSYYALQVARTTLRDVVQ